MGTTGKSLAGGSNYTCLFSQEGNEESRRTFFTVIWGKTVNKDATLKILEKITLHIHRCNFLQWALPTKQGEPSQQSFPQHLVDYGLGH